MSVSEANAAVSRAREHGATIAAAESLTGGAVCVALAEVPGVSDVLRGGVVTYSVEAKHDVLGVDQSTLDTHGPVSREVAVQMATGVRRTMGARIGLATTGAAGPEPHGGKPPGTVWVAVDFDGQVVAKQLHVKGERGDVTKAAVDAVLACCVEVLGGDVTSA